MEKTQITKINDMLFEQIKRMADCENIKGKKLQEEVERSKSMAELAAQVIDGETLEMKKEVMMRQFTGSRSGVAGYLSNE